MKRYRWLIAGAIILALPILLVGCVAKSEFEALRISHESLQEETINLQTDYDSLLKQNTDLQTDYDSLQANSNILLEEKANLETELAEMLIVIESLEEHLEDLENTINLYRYTYGTVFSKVQPPYDKTFGTPTNLINNEEATNPTWEELKIFLGADETDRDFYLASSQMCGYFAEKLHNNAEKAGIKSAYVAVNLGGENFHTLNAFKPLDSGLVFIDSTGREIQPILGGWSPPADPSWDKIVTLRMGQEIIYENLFPERATYTSWPMYKFQKWEVEWESIGTAYDIEVYW